MPAPQEYLNLNSIDPGVPFNLDLHKFRGY